MRKSRNHLVRRWMYLALTLIYFVCLFGNTACIKKSSTITVKNTHAYICQITLIENYLSFYSEITSKVFSLDQNAEKEDINIIDAISYDNGSAYLWTIDKQSYISVHNQEGKNILSFSLGDDLPGVPQKLLSYADKSFFVLLSQKEDSSWDETYYGISFGTDGQELLAPRKMELPIGLQVISADVDSQGNLLLLGPHSVVCMSHSLTLQYVREFDENSWMTSLAYASDGKIYASRINDSNQIEVLTIDPKTGKTDKTNVISGLISPQTSLLYGMQNGVSGGIAIDTGEEIIRYDPENRTAKQFLNWSYEGINDANISCIVFQNDNTLRFLGSYAVGENFDDTDAQELYGLIQITALEIPKDRKILTVGVLTNDETGLLQSAIYLFNRSSVDYEIQIKEYVDTFDISNQEELDVAIRDGLMRMKADLLSGESPDILCLDPVYMKTLEDSTILSDLEPIIDADSEFDESDYLPNVWQAGEKEGHRYWITPTFSVSGIFGTKDILNDRTTWSMDEFISIVDGDETHECLFLQYNYKHSYQRLMRIFFSTFEDQYIDWDTATTDFDNIEFEEALTFIKDNSNPINTSQSPQEALQSGKTMFYDASVRDFAAYPCYMAYFGGAIQCVGYPSEDETGPQLGANYYYAISAQSLNQNDSWEFLKYLLSNDIQNMSDRSITGGIPIRMSAFDAMIQLDSDLYASGSRGAGPTGWVDETPMVVDDPSTWHQTVTPEIIDVTDEMISAYRQMIASATTFEYFEPAIMNIMMEESEAFFEGDKSAKDTAAIIQNRVQTYVSEVYS